MRAKVGEHLGVSYATVSRAVKQAEKRGEMSNVRPLTIRWPAPEIAFRLFESEIAPGLAATLASRNNIGRNR